MSDIKMEDVTGQPRPERDIIQAIEYLEKQMVTDPMGTAKDGTPRVIHYITMRDALKELLVMRRVIAAARAKRQPPPSAPVYDREAPTHPGKANAIPPPPSVREPLSSFIEGEGSFSPDGIPAGTKEP